MTGRSEAAGGTEAWLEGVFHRLKALTEDLLAVTEAAGPPGIGEVDRRGRTIGVIARAAKIVAGLSLTLKLALRPTRDMQEDDMRHDHDIIDDAEDGRLRDELESRIDHLCGIVERKGRGARAGAPGGPVEAEGADGDGAAADGRAGVAA